MCLPEPDVFSSIVKQELWNKRQEWKNTLYNNFKLNQENSCKSAHILKEIRLKCENKSSHFSTDVLMFFFFFLYLQPPTPLEERVTRSDGHTRLWERESRFRFVCPILSIKPPLVATWLGGSGFTAVDMDRKWQHCFFFFYFFFVFFSIYTFYFCMCVFVCVCQTSPRKTHTLHSHTYCSRDSVSLLKVYETLFFVFLAAPFVRLRGHVISPPQPPKCPRIAAEFKCKVKI